MPEEITYKNLNAHTAKTTPGANDDLLLFDDTSNEATKIDYDNLADAILNKLTSKTFTNQVGGSSAATLLAQLATLNSNTAPAAISYTANSDCIGENNLYFRKVGKVIFVGGYFKTKGAEISDNTIMFTLDGQPNLSQTFYLFIYGYDKTIKGKLEPTGGNKLKASGSFSAYSAYCYCNGWLWT